ncbi:unnamed protein product [Cuscuta epithymum]|uniref:SHSP domain-containing protein n=2 Tax=Cuscuta epithymum TaxID=186058 RepID=A0AAV0D5R8_9ASTE|nr:unnamed protein product [Cuscuta epithymum]
MELPPTFFYPLSSSLWHPSFNRPLFFPTNHSLPQTFVHWRETPESHIYSADLPGVEKEKIRVEIEDSIYLIIRTEESGESSFMRKFRLPGMNCVDQISAGYIDGVLTVDVPRESVRRGWSIDPSDLISDMANFGASAA